MNEFLFSIITADKIVYEGMVVCAIVASENGKFGILKNHAPLLAAIVPGEIIIKEQSKRLCLKFYQKGFLEILANKATVVFPSFA